VTKIAGARIYLLLVSALILLIAPQSLAQAIEVIEYRDPRSFTSYWSFEPFKPLPPRDVSPVVVPIATNM
jgi:hypothetical protein